MSTIYYKTQAQELEELLKKALLSYADRARSSRKNSGAGFGNRSSTVSQGLDSKYYY